MHVSFEKNSEGKYKTIIYDVNGDYVEVVEGKLYVANQKNYHVRFGRIYFSQKNYSEALKYFDNVIGNFGAYYIGNSQEDKNALKFDNDNKKIQAAQKRVSKLVGKK